MRKIANGSLMPDSTSSVALTRGRNRSPRACSRKNTAAASVEAMTAPISSASSSRAPSAHMAAGAVSAAVTSTPTVASMPAGPITLRKVWKRVRSPPSKRIEAERHRAHHVGERHIVEPDAERPRLAGQHAHQQEGEQQRRPETQRNEARQDAGQH